MLILDHTVPKLLWSPGNVSEPEIYIWVLAPAGSLPNLATLAKTIIHSKPMVSEKGILMFI